jgi:virulence factor Mce-like protein
MSIFSRKRKHPNDPGMAPFTAGLLTIVVLALAGFVGFTKFNPIGHPYTVQAVFKTANNIKPNSPVRIAGVEIGKVKKVQAIEGNNGATTVTMELKKAALPIHKDTTMKIRPRTFLEGNYFVDIKPGSPSSPSLESGAMVPSTQTSAPVQFGDVLATLQSDTRADLQTFLKEYSKGLEGKGAAGFNQSLRYGPAAFKSTAQVNDALLGIQPTKDLQRVLKGQARTFAALNEDENALKGLVSNLNTTAGAFARQDVALEASIPALRDVLRVGSPALASLNSALPTLRVFSREALPGVRSSTPTLRASLPFIHQARLLVGPDELQGTAAQLRKQIPNLAGFNRTSVPLLNQVRALSSCTSNVLVPFANTPIPNPDEPGNSGQGTVRQANRGFVGLSGESRVSDGNLQYFRTSAVAPPLNVRPAAPTDGGNQPPPRRPDVPCETQEKPNLNAPGGSVAQFPVSTAGSRSIRTMSQAKPGSKFNDAKLAEAGKVFRDWQKNEGADKRKSFQKALKKLAAEAKP